MRPVLLAMLFVATTAMGCGGETTAEAPPTTATMAPGAPADRAPAPAVEGTTLAGERISLEGFRGRPVLINVWSSW
jgi:hypothetical protein